MWLDDVVDSIVQRRRDVYTLTTSVSPTGVIHIGKLRDITLVYFVHKALLARGENVKTILYWDDYDVFHKGKDYMEQKGLPLILVKDERNKLITTLYKERYEKELHELGVEFDIIISQADRYIRREYDEFLYSSYLNGGKIQKIQTDKKSLIICRAYCPECSKILDNKSGYFSFFCKYCGKEFEYSKIDEINYKLPFFIEWASRWAKDSSDFEPIGIDHASPNGVFFKSSWISENIFDYPTPVAQRYEFVGGSKGKKLSVSSKNGLTITEFLMLFTKEIIFWIFFKTNPKKYLVLDINKKELYLNYYIDYLKMLVKPSSHFTYFLDIMNFPKINNYDGVNIKQLFNFLDFTYNGKYQGERVLELPNFHSESLISSFIYWHSITGNIVNLKSTEMSSLDENQKLLVESVIKLLVDNKNSCYDEFKQANLLFKGYQKEIKEIIFGTYKIPDLSKMLYVYSFDILDFYGVYDEN